MAPGDQILVDRLAAEPGSSLKLDRVLLLRDGDDIKVGSPAVDGLEVEAKVLAHRRGPRIESLRYKSKKRVRVHRGGRADLTALQILAVGGLTVATGTELKVEGDHPASGLAPKVVKAKVAPKKKAVAELKAQAAETVQEVKAQDAAAPAKRVTRTAKKAPTPAKETK